MDSDETAKTPRPFDVETVRVLVRFMSRHNLNEIDLQEGDHRIRIRRGLGSANAAAPVIVQASPVPAHTHATPAGGAMAPPTPTAPTAPEKKLVPIKSPTIGVFFRAREEGGKPLVDVGSRVTPSTVVGLVMAMKLLTDIPAECTGVITEVVAQNGEAVEYNSVLFLVDPAG